MRGIVRAIAIAGLAGAALFVSASVAHAPAPSAPSASPDATASPPAAADGGAFPLPLQTAQRTLQDPAISELSGLAASQLHPGVVYGINDSGGQAVVFAIDSAGNTVARLRLAQFEARDWEAIAPGRDDDGRPVLWIGDIGDNLSNQKRVRVIRIAEPAALVDQDVDWQAFAITYPDGPHNAETLVVHPADGALSVITKGDAEPGAMYRLPQPLRRDGVNTATRVGDVPPGITDGAYELSQPQAPRLVLTDYWQLHRLGETGWVSALGPLQLQREALAWPWLPEGQPNDLVLVGAEGTGSTIKTATVP